MSAETLGTPTSTGTTTPSVPFARSASSAAINPAGTGTLLAAAPVTAPPFVQRVGRRLPRLSRPEPRLRQLMGVCGWAAVLGGVGLVLGIRALAGVLSNDAPTWYEPSIIAAGFVGIGLTVGAFLTVHRRREPWVLLGLSSMSLVTGMLLTSSAF